MLKRYFITIEGLEGAGKSVVLPFIEKYLKENKINFIITREPGGTKIAEKIRDVVLSHSTETVHKDTELLLYFAARAQHLAEIINPALSRGLWVLSDRFTDATYAYQGAGRGIDANKIEILENLVQGDLRPDLVLILDVDPQVGLQRISKERELDRLEIEQIGFYNRVRDCYLQRAKQNPNRYRIIDANQPLERVIEKTKEIISTLF